MISTEQYKRMNYVGDLQWNINIWRIGKVDTRKLCTYISRCLGCNLQHDKTIMFTSHDKDETRFLLNIHLQYEMEVT